MPLCLGGEPVAAAQALRDTGVMAIKSVARRPWGDVVPTNSTWYEPFVDAESITRGVHFALSTPGVHAICTAGDVTLLPTVLAAAASFESMADAARSEALAAAGRGRRSFRWPSRPRLSLGRVRG